MKTIFFWTFLCSTVLSLNAQIQGPKNGSNFSVLAIPGSSGVWAIPGNASVSDNVYTSFGDLPNPGSYTDYLVATNFGFTIPSGVIINGIVVEVERSDPNLRTSDYSIRIIKGGTLGTTEKSIGSGYPFADSYHSYGNASDLWGETWAPSNINAANFGVAIAAQRNSTSSTTTDGRIDHIRIFVYYNFNTLPIRLINFYATKSGKNININWVTAEEVDINHYDIERSANARDFINIETITSSNQFVQKTYSATDNNPLAIKSFYRIKIVENNGVVKYSKVIAFDPGKENMLTLYPTIWKKGLPLFISNFNNEKLEISFFNGNGQLISKSSTNSNQLGIDQLNKMYGILFYTIFNNSGKLRGSGKIIVN